MRFNTSMQKYFSSSFYFKLYKTNYLSITILEWILFADDSIEVLLFCWQRRYETSLPQEHDNIDCH